MIRVPNSFSLAVLDELSEAAGLLDGALVKLFKNDVIPDENSAVATFTPADFTGYAPSAAVVWNPAGVGQDGSPRLIGDQKLFTAGTPLTVSNTVYGYYVTNTAGTELLFAERFPNAVIIATPGQQLPVLPIVSLVSQV